MRAVNERLREWTALFVDRESAPIPTKRRDAPALTATAAGERLIIRDTRSCAVASRHMLGPLEARIYRACDAVTSASVIAGTLERAGTAVPAAQVDDILESFTERKLVCAFGNRILSLAVDAPMAPYGDPFDFPAGLLLPSGAAMKPSPRSFDSAWEVPIAALPRFLSSGHRSAPT